MVTHISTHKTMKIVETNLLIRLKQANINEPVQELYRNYFESVTFYLQSIGGNGEDAADVFQESVLIFIDQVKTDRFRGESSINTYLTGIARNVMLNEIRSKTRRSVREVQYMESESEEPVDEIHHRMFSKENSNRLTKVFESVGDPCKKILKGFYFEDLSMKELLQYTNYENEQVLRNKKSKCMKFLKDIISSNTELNETLKSYLAYVK
jgi:RNA polymerase sigma factor (sigma-70 family)